MSDSVTASKQAIQKAAETPYVVLFQNVGLLAANGGRHNWEQVQESWAFEHRPSAVTALVYDSTGLPLTNGHNVRSATHTFHIPHAGTCHGLAGYFEAHLYGDVAMSIHPDPMRASKDMLSWFPIYFPFKDPLYLPANSELDVHMWRQSGNNKVWYEWCAEVFMPLPADAIRSVDPSSSVGAATAGANSASGLSSEYANAIATPRIPSGSGPPPASEPSNGTQLHASPLVSGQVTRVKTGMTALHNPGGRSSWIGL